MLFSFYAAVITDEASTEILNPAPDVQAMDKVSGEWSMGLSRVNGSVMEVGSIVSSLLCIKSCKEIQFLYCIYVSSQFLVFALQPVKLLTPGCEASVVRKSEPLPANKDLQVSERWPGIWMDMSV